MESEERLKRLFLKYLGNTCTDRELGELLTYFHLEKDQGLLKSLIRQKLEEEASDDPEEQARLRALVQRVDVKVMEKLDEREQQESGQRRQVPGAEDRPSGTGLPVVRRFRRNVFIKIAAAATLTLLLGLGWLYRTTLYNLLDPVQYEQVLTGKGERKIIRLTDGTKIWLSPASMLEYPRHFRGSARQVRLSGEAFFEVTPDKSHPFIVSGEKLKTRVLGTSFNVQAYADLPVQSVTVLSGRVAVSARTGVTQQEVQLNQEQRALFSATDGSFRKEDYPDAAQLLERREGTLSYRGTPVLQILQELQRIYPVRIETEGDLKECTFFGTLNAGDDVFRFLQKVGLSINAKVERRKNTIVLSGNGCEGRSLK